LGRHPVLLYSDVNLNLIDGSSIWVASVADALVGAGAEVTLLSRQQIQDHRVVAPLMDRPEIHIVDPVSEGFIEPGKRLRPSDAVRVIAALSKRGEGATIIVRGSAVSAALAAAKVGRGRLWCYLTDIPQSIADASPDSVAQLRGIALWSDRILCQTEQLRGFLENAVPEAVGKTALLPPIVPDEVYESRTRGRSDERVLSLAYSGKFAPRWRTLEMCSLPGELRRRGIEARLVMLGEKIHNDSGSPAYTEEMKRALTESYGVTWLGGLARQEAMERVSTADVALAWRDPALDASLELSTKLLEFGACGVPAVLNRTPMHEDLLGHDYPLFANTLEAVLDALVRAADSPDLRRSAADRLAQTAARYSSKEASVRLTGLLTRARRARGTIGWTGGRDQTLLIAGHDLKFIQPIADFLGTHTDTRVILDKWQGQVRHNVGESVERLREADVVLCEWMLGNAVWYSHNKLPHQRLVVRLHRVELETDYPAKADLDAIDATIFVGQDMAERAQKEFGIPAHKCVVVPNAVDVSALARSKDYGHEHVLGMIGAVPTRKRLDLAIELLRELRAVDQRFRLHVKSKAPWELSWVWNQPEERKYFEGILRDIADDPELADAVLFDDAGPNIAEWLKKVGWIVSTSDAESFHVTVVEGMSSGAVPLVRAWRGAAQIYDQAWLHDNVTSMASAVSDILGSGRYQEMASRARAEAARFDLPDVASAIASVLAGRNAQVSSGGVSAGGES
jgi:glycosyltransferase involved in cell wall biosynthesis